VVSIFVESLKDELEFLLRDIKVIVFKEIFHLNKALAIKSNIMRFALPLSWLYSHPDCYQPT